MCCALNILFKIIMSIVNVLLLLIGIVLTVLGALLLWGFTYFMKGVYPIEAQIKAMLAKFGVATDGQAVMNLMQANSYTIGAIAFGVGIVLIGFAILSIVLVACCDLKNLLIIVIVIIILIALGLIILIGIFGVNKTKMIFDPLVNYLQTGIINKYQGLNYTNAESIVVNVIQVTVSCCGLYNYSDFDTSTQFNRNAVNSTGQNVRLQFPISCCGFNNDFTIDRNTLDSCITNGTSVIKNNGCWNVVKPYMDHYLGYCFLTIGITIAILVAVVIVGIITICCLRKTP